eukprot:504197-Prymnesium_polylepis.1
MGCGMGWEPWGGEGGCAGWWRCVAAGLGHGGFAGVRSEFCAVCGVLCAAAVGCGLGCECGCGCDCGCDVGCGLGSCGLGSCGLGSCGLGSCGLGSCGLGSCGQLWVAVGSCRAALTSSPRGRRH